MIRHVGPTFVLIERPERRHQVVSLRVTPDTYLDHDFESASVACQAATSLLPKQVSI